MELLYLPDIAQSKLNFNLALCPAQVTVKTKALNTNNTWCHRRHRTKWLCACPVYELPGSSQETWGCFGFYGQVLGAGGCRGGCDLISICISPSPVPLQGGGRKNSMLSLGRRVGSCFKAWVLFSHFPAVIRVASFSQVCFSHDSNCWVISACSHSDPGAFQWIFSPHPGGEWWSSIHSEPSCCSAAWCFSQLNLLIPLFCVLFIGVG